MPQYGLTREKGASARRLAIFICSYSKKQLSPGRIPRKISNKSNKVKTFPCLLCCPRCTPATDWPLTRFALSVYLSKLFPFSFPSFFSPSPLPVLAKTFEFCIRAHTQLTQTHTNQWLFLYLMWISSWWHIEGLQWIHTQSALWSDNGGSRGTVGGNGEVEGQICFFPDGQVWFWPRSATPGHLGDWQGGQVASSTDRLFISPS